MPSTSTRPFTVSSALATRDIARRPDAWAWASRATCSGVAATVMVRATVPELCPSPVAWSTAITRTALSIRRVNSPRRCRARTGPVESMWSSGAMKPETPEATSTLIWKARMPFSSLPVRPAISPGSVTRLARMISFGSIERRMKRGFVSFSREERAIGRDQHHVIACGVLHGDGFGRGPLLRRLNGCLCAAGGCGLGRILRLFHAVGADGQVILLHVDHLDVGCGQRIAILHRLVHRIDLDQPAGLSLKACGPGQGGLGLTHVVLRHVDGHTRKGHADDKDKCENCAHNQPLLRSGGGHPGRALTPGAPRRQRAVIPSGRRIPRPCRRCFPTRRSSSLHPSDEDDDVQPDNAGSHDDPVNRHCTVFDEAKRARNFPIPSLLQSVAGPSGRALPTRLPPECGETMGLAGAFRAIVARTARASSPTTKAAPLRTRPCSRCLVAPALASEVVVGFADFGRDRGRQR